jgi:hypothetical protein
MSENKFIAFIQSHLIIIIVVVLFFGGGIAYLVFFLPNNEQKTVANLSITSQSSSLVVKSSAVSSLIKKSFTTVLNSAKAPTSPTEIPKLPEKKVENLTDKPAENFTDNQPESINTIDNISIQNNLIPETQQTEQDFQPSVIDEIQNLLIPEQNKITKKLDNGYYKKAPQDVIAGFYTLIDKNDTETLLIPIIDGLDPSENEFYLISGTAVKNQNNQFELDLNLKYNIEINKKITTTSPSNDNFQIPFLSELLGNNDNDNSHSEPSATITNQDNPADDE